MSDHWANDAACATEPNPGRVFFERELAPIALRYCAACPVSSWCLEGAMDEERGLPISHRYGIRGGLGPIERWKLAQGERRRGERVA